ncbi:MAG: hypothetical protein ACHQU1_09790 [Gemmatimonadales bacterium]
MADNLEKRRIDREALERIIQRAAELQAGEMDTGESMTESELLKLGADVGIDGRFLRQAMYEQSAGGVAGEKGLIARWFGPARVFASRVVSGDKAHVEDAIAQWMSDGEALQVKRRMSDRTVWEEQKGFLANMKRGFGVGGRSYQLARARDVTVVVTALEDGFCHVELTADISQLRQGAVGASVGSGAALLLIGGSTIVLTTLTVIPLAVVASLGLVLVAAAAGAPVVAGRVQRTRGGQMQLALEQVLDRLEHGEIRPRHRELDVSPLARFAFDIRAAITSTSQGTKRRHE